jgi:hypothetical protein
MLAVVLKINYGAGDVGQLHVRGPGIKSSTLQKKFLKEITALIYLIWRLLQKIWIIKEIILENVEDEISMPISCFSLSL